MPKTELIYSKEIIYTFKYSIFKNSRTEIGTIYLGCLGKLAPFIGPKQFGIIWTQNLDELKSKLINTGAIEDSSRIFIHPPRNNQFKIL